MPSFFPFGKAGGLQIRRCRRFAVADYGFTSGALAQEPSDFCNDRVNFSPASKMPEGAPVFGAPFFVPEARRFPPLGKKGRRVFP